MVRPSAIQCFPTESAYQRTYSAIRVNESGQATYRGDA